MPKKVAREPSGFWEQPQMMNLVADLLVVAATLALGYAAALAALRLPFFPLQEVVVTTPLARVTAAQVEYAARSAVAGNFFTVDIERVRGAFEKLPWVRRASARRVWPQGIAVEIEEHEAVAAWKPGETDSRLVNRHGEVFAAATRAALPELAGPEGSAPEMLQRYRELAEILAPIGRRPQRVLLSSRLAWQLRLDNGLVMDLGRDEPRVPTLERVRRFVAVYREAVERVAAPVAAADLRYPNGFALRLASGRIVTKSR